MSKCPSLTFAPLSFFHQTWSFLKLIELATEQDPVLTVPLRASSRRRRSKIVWCTRRHPRCLWPEWPGHIRAPHLFYLLITFCKAKLSVRTFCLTLREWHINRHNYHFCNETSRAFDVIPSSAQWLYPTSFFCPETLGATFFWSFFHKIDSGRFLHPHNY